MTWLATALMPNVPHYVDRDIGHGYIAIPDYSTDPVAFDALLVEIGRRGLGGAYLSALSETVFNYDATEWGADEVWGTRWSLYEIFFDIKKCRGRLGAGHRRGVRRVCGVGGEVGMAERKSTAKATGQLIPQAHGGALRNGGPNRGGTGRPPSELRQLCREKFEKRIPTLDAIAASSKSKDSDRISAIATLGRFGLDPSVRIADVKDRLRAQADIIRQFEHLSPEHANLLLERMQSAWLKL